MHEAAGVRRDELLSLEEGHPSMGKMTGANGDRRGGGSRLIRQSGLEVDQLGLGKSMEKGLKEDDSLAEAGVEIVVDGVKCFPLTVRMERLAPGELLDRGLETSSQFIDKIGEDRNLVKELGFAREKDFAEKVIEASDALAPGILKIFGGERGEIGSGAKMLGVFQHGVEHRVKRMGQPLTKSRGNRED